MARFRIAIALSLVLPLIGGGVSWAIPLSLMAHGIHHTSVHAAHGRVTIVLDHTDSDHHHDHDHGSDAEHSSHSTDHVFALSTPDACSTVRPLLLNHPVAVPVPVTVFVPDSATLRLGWCTACSGVSPPAPSRSVILQV